MKSKEEVLRQKILEGASRLFQEHGLAKTTMEDIAREAGKGKSTLYYYFKSKEEIFDAIIFNENLKYCAELQELVSAAPTAQEKLRTFMHYRLQAIHKFINLYNLILREIIADASEQCNSLKRKNSQDYFNKQVAILTSILQYGIVTGEFRVMSDAEINLVSFAFITSIKGMDIEMIQDDIVQEYFKKTDFFVDLIINGIRK